MNKTEICGQFEIDDFEGIVIAGETKYEDYEGSAAIVFVNNGKLYWQGGGHCSCNGFEGQWSPEETSSEVLQRMAADGYGIEKEVASEALDVVNKFGTDPDALAAAMALYYGVHA